MQASETQIEALLDIQKIDLLLLKLQKQFDELPQRQQILDVRKKVSELGAKEGVVEKLLADARKKVVVIEGKDESFEKRAADLQKDIDASSDFRNIEKKSKELAGVSRQREALLDEMAAAEAEIEKIESIQKQLAEAKDALAKREAALVASFQSEGGDLKQAIADATIRRSEIEKNLDADLLKLYKATAQKCAGVAIGKLNADRCGVCRAELDDIRLLQIKREAPLATCPYCKRLLVVE